MQCLTEVAWAAGFWDGEGCCYKGTDGAPRLSISQVNRANLERFRMAVGQGRINGPYGGTKLNQREFWQWRVHGKRASKVMALLLPLIGDEKRQQFEAIARPAEVNGQLILVRPSPAKLVDKPVF